MTETCPYELLSIMIHEGNLTRGHYYNYSKNCQSGRWILFNDEKVSQVII